MTNMAASHVGRHEGFINAVHVHALSRLGPLVDLHTGCPGGALFERINLAVLGDVVIRVDR